MLRLLAAYEYRKTRKRWRPALAVASFGALVAACGGSSDSDSDQAAPSPINAVASVTLTLPQSEDDGGPVGTLFSLVDREGRPVCEVGFNWSYSSRVAGPNRLLQLWCTNDREAVELASVGKPSGDVFRAAVTNLDGRVIELTSNRWLEVGSWVTAASAGASPIGMSGAVRRARPGDIGSYGGLTQNVQPVGNTTVRFVYRDYPAPTRVVYGETVIATAEFDLAAGIYAYGFVWLSPIQGEAVYRCAFAPGVDQTCGPLERIEFAGGSAYALAAWNDAVWIGDSLGQIWRIDRDGSVNHEFDGARLDPLNSGRAGEFYSFAVFGDSLVAGHYPSGRLVRRTPTGSWIPFGPPLGSIENLGTYNATELEVQSLLVYAGRLWAGVYPWGELWQISPDGEAAPPLRLFAAPERANPPFPYSDKLLKAAIRIEPGASGICSFDGTFDQFLTWANAQTTWIRDCLARIGYVSKTDWGQRVPTLTIAAAAIYAATGNRLDHGYDPVRDERILTPIASEEYGRVWAVRLKNAGSMPVSWPTDGRLRLDVQIERSRRIAVRAAAPREVAIDDVDLSRVTCVRLGVGSYGRAPVTPTAAGMPWPSCEASESSDESRRATALSLR